MPGITVWDEKVLMSVPWLGGMHRLGGADPIFRPPPSRILRGVIACACAARVPPTIFRVIHRTPVPQIP